jgi:TIR domain
MPQPTRDHVFISYSHRDKEWLGKLQTMLKPMVRNKLVSVWDDTKINAGAIWQEEIRGALAAARVAVLLVSPHFLESDFIAEHELPPLLDAAKKEGLVILWVYISHCLYDETEIKRYQAANDISKPLDSLTPSEQNAVLVNVCRRIKDAANAPIGLSETSASSAAAREVALSDLLDHVILKITAPTVVDRGRISAAFSRFGANWPPVKIEWPRSADELLNLLGRALEQFDKGAANLLSSYIFAKEVSEECERIPTRRRQTEDAIPAMVKRLRCLHETDRAKVVADFLLLANVRIHSSANYHASWEGLRHLGLNPPVAWDPFRGQSSEREFAIALSEPEEELIMILLVRVAGVEIPGGRLCSKLF